MNHPSRRLPLLLLALTLAWGMPVRAGLVLFDTLGQDGPYDLTFSDATWLAQAFTTPDFGLAVESVALALDNPTATGGDFALELWSSLDGMPGSVLYTIFSGPTSAITGPIFTVSQLDLAVTPLTEYYVVARGVNLTGLGRLQWSYAALALGVGTPSSFSLSNDQGRSWSPPSLDSPQKMLIVPEPSMLALLGLGLAGWRLTRRPGKLRQGPLGGQYPVW